jgi:hypothetical protein
MEDASVGDPFAVLLLANTAVAEAGPFPHLTIETIELTVEHSIELPTTEAILANQVWCGTLHRFDELAICVERTKWARSGCWWRPSRSTSARAPRVWRH